MKTNKMLTNLRAVFIAATAIALLSTSAFAGGGKNERMREARDVKIPRTIETPSAVPSTSYVAERAEREGRVHVDKGERGHYVRSGRHLSRVRTEPSAVPSTSYVAERAEREARAHVDKGERGHYVRSGRHLSRVRTEPLVPRWAPSS